MRSPRIDKSLFAANRKRLTEHMKPSSVAAFISNDLVPVSADRTYPFLQNTDLYYLTGIDQEETILVLCPDAKEEKHREMLFVRETNDEIAVWEGPKLSKREASEVSGVKTVHWTTEFETLFRQIAFETDSLYLNTNEHVRASHSVETGDIRFLNWCKKNFPLHKYERTAPVMHRLRSVKAKEEQALIRHACHITGKTFERILDFIKPGVWEYEIEAEIYHEFLRNRSRGPAYQPVVASGANSCILHYVKNDCQCLENDIVLIDIGAEYGGYASDVTRTIPVGGKFNKRQKDVYNSVLRVQQKAIKRLVVGNTFTEYNKDVEKFMTEELIGLGLVDERDARDAPPENPAHKKYFMHGISHFLGLDVHDYGSKYAVFEEGMVLTCEPGIYIKEEGLGIRLENDILITPDGPVDLTGDIPIDAEAIEEIMNA
jgi:Xaa-Pro aminopeptidase